MRSLTIADRLITDESAPYLIGEIGHNHGGVLATAQKLIKVAAQAGVSAVKLQKREVATLYTKAMRAKPYEHEHSYGATYGAHREALEFGETAYRACQQTAQKYGVTCFATAFDEPSVDFLMGLGVPAIKIASGGLTDLPLLAYASSMRVPLILSTGGGTMIDIDRAIATVTRTHNALAVLHCTAAYPVLDFAELNLRCITTLRERYPDLVVGWSGHDAGIAMALVAYAFGARIIEKHITLNRASKGTDHAFSLDPSGLKKLCRDLERAHDAFGTGVKQMYESERAPLSKMTRWFIEGRWQIGTDTEQTPRVHA